VSYHTGIGSDPAPREVPSPELEKLSRLSDEQYARVVQLQSARLARVRLDWRFWVGLGATLGGTALLLWSPNLKAAGGRAKTRLGAVAKPVTGRL